MTDFSQWQTASFDDTIDYILERYHRKGLEQFAEVVALTEKVTNAHGDKFSPEALPHVRVMMQELQSHFMKEEQALFPMIRNGIGRGAAMPIRVMMMEHDDHEAAVARLLELTNNLELPAGACQTWTRLYEVIREFVDDLHDHIYLENEILFPRVLAS